MYIPLALRKNNNDVNHKMGITLILYKSIILLTCHFFSRIIINGIVTQGSYNFKTKYIEPQINTILTDTETRHNTHEHEHSHVDTNNN